MVYLSRAPSTRGQKEVVYQPIMCAAHTNLFIFIVLSLVYFQDGGLRTSRHLVYDFVQQEPVLGLVVMQVEEITSIEIVEILNGVSIHSNHIHPILNWVNSWTGNKNKMCILPTWLQNRRFVVLSGHSILSLIHNMSFYHRFKGLQKLNSLNCV